MSAGTTHTRVCGCCDGATVTPVRKADGRWGCPTCRCAGPEWAPPAPAGATVTVAGPAPTLRSLFGAHPNATRADECDDCAALRAALAAAEQARAEAEASVARLEAALRKVDEPDGALVRDAAALYDARAEDPTVPLAQARDAMWRAMELRCIGDWLDEARALAAPSPRPRRALAAPGAAPTAGECGCGLWLCRECRPETAPQPAPLAPEVRHYTQSCEGCAGTGEQDVGDDDTRPCSRCTGTGRVQITEAPLPPAHAAGEGRDDA